MIHIIRSGRLQYFPREDAMFLLQADCYGTIHAINAGSLFNSNSYGRLWWPLVMRDWLNIIECWVSQEYSAKP